MTKDDQLSGNVRFSQVLVIMPILNKYLAVLFM